ncbi:MAG: Stp1/IreP family PP2C-type Ser/Thr phosphatase [Oscillospiraceae bacterium]|nr:Stp1/IreP family PP2C-type Ser/Thr phosphatase [Oscillospiraceae bacterium]
MEIKALTDVGKVRKINEDSFAIYSDEKYSYAVVADGMGGHLAGEVASSIAVTEIGNYIKDHLTDELDRFQAQEVLRSAFRYANDKIYKYSLENERVMGMGTTATMCMIRGGYVIIAHVGDSRAYMARDNITQLTKDHSYVQELVKLGMITTEEAKRHPHRNRITRAMGVEPEVKADAAVKPYNGESLLLCTDGLYGEIEDGELLSVINENSAEEAVNKLMALALERGGADNITAVVLKGVNGNNE